MDFLLSLLLIMAVVGCQSEVQIESNYICTDCRSGFTSRHSWTMVVDPPSCFASAATTSLIRNRVLSVTPMKEPNIASSRFYNQTYIMQELYTTAEDLMNQEDLSNENQQTIRKLIKNIKKVTNGKTAKIFTEEECDTKWFKIAASASKPSAND